MSPHVPGYFTAYENLAMERSDTGVLTVRLHTNGGPITFTGTTHREFARALVDIADDPANRVLVLTGTGDVFIDEIDGASLGEIFKPAVWNQIWQEGTSVLQRLIELPIPVVGVANGPATAHSEYLLLADILVASERATFADPHPAELVPHDQALARGKQIAEQLAQKPTLYLRLQKHTLNQHLRRRIQEGLAYGMALEGLTAADLAHQQQAAAAMTNVVTADTPGAPLKSELPPIRVHPERRARREEWTAVRKQTALEAS
jgi:enoyl-CoA hydratase/carnithine racemase